MGIRGSRLTCERAQDINSTFSEGQATVVGSSIVPLSVEIEYVELPSFQLFKVRNRNVVEFVYGSPIDAYVFFMPLEGVATIEEDGREFILKSGSIGLFDLSRVSRLTKNAGCSSLEFYSRKDIVYSFLKKNLKLKNRDDIEFQHVLLENHQSYSGIIDFATTIWGFAEKALKNNSVTIYQHTIEAAMFAFMTSVIESWDSNLSPIFRGRASVISPKPVRAALSFMNENSRNQINVKDIALAAGISVRTLQYLFVCFQGVTPMEYLRAIRLKGAREELLNQGPDTIVSEVAARWCFGNAGRFSRLYRQEFGTLPSDTIRKGLGVK